MPARSAAGTPPSEGGFSIIPNWVIRDSDLTAHELLVYIALLNRANSDGLAWPSVPRIARESRTSVTTVKRTIRSLEARQLVSKQVRPRGDGSNDTNVYRVAVFTRTPSAVRPKPSGHREPTLRPDRANPGTTVNYKEDPVEEEPSEEDVRSALKRGHANSSSFVDTSSTETQLLYLYDLHIHYNNEVPTKSVKARWAKLDKFEAQALIKRYLQEIPRYDAYEGPEYGEPTYEALSDVGKLWADTGMIPEAAA